MLKIKHPNGKLYETDADTWPQFERRGFEIVEVYGDAAEPETAPLAVPHLAGDVDVPAESVVAGNATASVDAAQDAEDGPDAPEAADSGQRPDIPPPSQLQRRAVEWLRDLAAAYALEGAATASKDEVIEMLTTARSAPLTVNQG